MDSAVYVFYFAYGFYNDFDLALDAVDQNRFSSHQHKCKLELFGVYV